LASGLFSEPVADVEETLYKPIVLDLHVDRTFILGGLEVLRKYEIEVDWLTDVGAEWYGMDLPHYHKHVVELVKGCAFDLYHSVGNTFGKIMIAVTVEPFLWEFHRALR
jgi:hypothetical protein